MLDKLRKVQGGTTGQVEGDNTVERTPGKTVQQDQGGYEVNSTKSSPVLQERLPGAGSSLAQVFALNKNAGDADQIKRGALRQALSVGRPLPPKVATALQELTGLQITRDGLAKLYEDCMPGTTAFVDASAKWGSVEYSIHWLDSDGNAVARINRRLGTDRDGAVELYSHGCWTDESHRDRALSAKVMAQETEMLRAISSAKNTRLSLWAGGMKDPKNPDDFQPIGIYVWANMGFDAAQNHGFRTTLTRSGARRPRCEEDKDDFRKYTDLQLAKYVFRGWIRRAMERGDLPNDRKVLSMLDDASRQWTSMWEISNFKVDGLRMDVEMGGRKVACDLGKAFLLSGEAPRWEGVFLVNQTDSVAHQVADLYNRPKIERADTKRKARIDGFLADLASDDAQVVADAIDGLGRAGDRSVIDRLQALAEARPQHAEAVEEAVDRLLGKKLTDGLEANARDRDLPVSERVDALFKLLEVSPGPHLKLLTSLIEDVENGTDLRMAREALRLLADGEGAARPELLFDLMQGLYEVGRSQDRWDPGYGSRLSVFKQRVKTRELVVDMMEGLEHPKVAEFLEAASRTDPYWEVAADATVGFVKRRGRADPHAAYALAKSFLDRNLARHREIPEGQKKEKRDLLVRLSRTRGTVIKELGSVADPEVGPLLDGIIANDPYWEPSEAALQSLAEHSGGRDLDRVRNAAKRLYDLGARYNGFRARGTVIKVLGDTLGTETALRDLADMIGRETDAYNLRQARTALSKHDAGWARNAVRKIDDKLAAIEAERKAKWKR